MTSEVASRAAVEWWVAAIRAVGPEAPEIRSDMTTPEVTLALSAVSLHDAHISRNRVTEERLAAFAAELDRRLRHADPGDAGVLLAVDYEPQGFLAEVADATGIDPSQFPRKTRMWVKDDHVVLRAGYGSRWRLIWSSPEYESPDCRERDWNDDGPIGVPCGQAMWHDGRHDWERR